MRAVLAALLFTAAVHAQDVDPALAPFAMMVGQWEGEAQMQTANGLLVLHQTEDVRVELGGQLLTVEGMGRRIEDGGQPGETLFNAFGVFSIDAESGTIYFDAFTREGRHVRVAPVVTDGGFDWSIEPEAGPRIHYQMRIDEEGRWVETGRMTFDDGETWRPFFEMTLRRVEAE